MSAVSGKEGFPPDESMGCKENDVSLTNQGVDKDVQALWSDVKTLLESGEYATLGPEDRLGKELLTIYREHGKEALEKAHSLLTSSGVLSESDKETALKLLKEEKGKNLQLRSIAADKLIGQVGSYQDKGILVTRRKDKMGHVKLELFHIADLTQAFGEGGGNKAYKVREEVFGTTYKDKLAIFRAPKTPDIVQSNVASLEWIRELYGELPAYIQKFPKMHGPEGQVLKLYGQQDLLEAMIKGLGVAGLFKALRGPMKALVFFKLLGIAHIDLKPDNIFLAEGAKEGVVGDFDKVYIFPPLNFADPEDVVKKAKRMLAIIGNDRPVQMNISPKYQTEEDYNAYVGLLNQHVVPGLEKIAAGHPPPKHFIKYYEQMRMRIELMQVMQVAVLTAYPLIGSDFFSCIVPEEDRDTQIFVTHLDEKLLKKQLIEVLGTSPFTARLFNLLRQMLRIDVAIRPKAEAVQAYYEDLLQNYAGL